MPKVLAGSAALQIPRRLLARRRAVVRSLPANRFLIELDCGVGSPLQVHQVDCGRLTNWSKVEGDVHAVAVKKWLDSMIIGLGFCPWARPASEAFLRALTTRTYRALGIWSLILPISASRKVHKVCPPSRNQVSHACRQAEFGSLPVWQPHRQLHWKT